MLKGTMAHLAVGLVRGEVAGKRVGGEEQRGGGGVARRRRCSGGGLTGRRGGRASLRHDEARWGVWGVRVGL